MSRPGGPTPGLFRASELTRLLMLLSILVVGLAFAYSHYERRAADAARAVAEPRPPRAEDELPPPDAGLEWDFVRDRTPLGRGDTPAYARLLERVRSTPPEELARAARRDVLFVQLLEVPKRYRGLPIHLEGTAKRILRQEAPDSALFPEGRYFEAYVMTRDSGKYPYFLVFEDPPPGLPVGDEVTERVAFDGYFLKMMVYQAGDVPRVAPLLIGRLRRLDGPAAPAAPPPDSRGYLPWVLGLLLALMALRWAFYLRGLFTRPVERPWQPPGAVRDAIEPGELSAWIEGQSEGDSDEDEPEPGRERWR